MELHVSLVGRDDLTGEIYRQLRRAILDGRLPPGERLPPTRELARRLAVSRSTVTVAYDRLTGEGFLSARQGAGTFVSDHVAAYAARARPAASALRPRKLWHTIEPSDVFRPVAFDFRNGIPDARLFPYQTWRRLLTRELHANADGIGTYADPAGHLGLRQAIARHVGTARGVRTTAEDVVVTNATQQAVDVVARVLLAPGDRVAVEDPGYRPPRRLLASLDTRVTGVPVDDQGLVVDAIPAGTRLVYVTPSHQFPLGMTMPLPRRLALLDWAERNDAAIVEDDYDSEFRYGDRPIEPLQTLDTSGRVIYVGTFSKTMLPTLRLGFVIAPASLRPAVRAAKYVTDWHTTLPAQAALARFIDEGYLARHVRKMRQVYQARHRLLRTGLRDLLGDRLEVLPSAAGLHLTAVAPGLSCADIDAALRRAEAAGVELQPLSMYDVGSPRRAGLVPGYGAIPAERIEEGLPQRMAGQQPTQLPPPAARAARRRGRGRPAAPPRPGTAPPVAAPPGPPAIPNSAPRTACRASETVSPADIASTASSVCSRPAVNTTSRSATITSSSPSTATDSTLRTSVAPSARITP